MTKNPVISEQISHYLSEEMVRELTIQKRLREETREKVEYHIMQITPDQGAFLQMITRLINAKHILEIGTFTGYSSLAMALAMPKDGKLVTCDTHIEWTDMARKFWAEAGVITKIELRLGFAANTLSSLQREGYEEYFDLIFIDADKQNYEKYYEKSLILLRSGGLIIFDNALWGGTVADPDNHEATPVALRKLNRKILDDERVDCSIVPIGDGMMLARKR